jgi:hypothetical protein
MPARPFTSSERVLRLTPNALAASVMDYLSGELIGHISRDSTAIMGREKPAKKVKEPKVARKKGRPAKGEVREALTEKRIARQINRLFRRICG